MISPGPALKKICRWLMAIAIALGTLVWAYSQSQILVGYAVLTPNVGMPAPVASALFTYSNSSGIIVSQAGVGSAPPFLQSRLFVDERDTRTGVAMVNTSSQTATVNIILRDSAGVISSQTSMTLNPGEHRSRFVDELFTTLTPDFIGSVTLESNQPLSSITLRQRQNSFGEPLYATLPVVDLGASSGSQLVFPHLAVGGGYVTQLVLFNRGSQAASGQVRFFASSGSPLTLRANNSNVSELSYTIQPDGVYQVDLESLSGLNVGYATLTAAAPNTAPAATVVFRFVKDNTVVTEAAVAAVRQTTLSRIYVDYLGSRTGVAMANPSQQATVATLTLMDRYGVVESTTTVPLAAGAHVARFVDELFDNVSDGFSGLMEIQSPVAIVPITLKVRLNARGDQILTTLPVADLTIPPDPGPLVLPQIAVGGGFSTRLIFLHPGSPVDANGQLRFVNSDASPMQLTMGNAVGSNFGYQVPAGNGRQLYPGLAGGVASVTLLDPTSGQPTNELLLTEGKAIRPRVRVIDTSGAPRDDFDASFQSSNLAVTSVDPNGLVRGVSSGFSTIVITVGGVVATDAATVVKVESAVPGYSVVGVAQDLANRLYLAATQDHTILRLEDFAQPPAIYAGIQASPGLKNDLRLQAQFRQPSFIAFDGGTGSIYVSDSANNVIRRIRPGATDVVETIAGTGVPGSADGPAAQASFNNPRGIALDTNGYLWIADSGNHTIRRLNIITRTVQTVAGSAGNPGSADGTSSQARFRNPSGIAVLNETAEQELERELRGDPPPPIEVVVADTGNNALRSVDATGKVSTFLGTSSSLVQGFGRYALRSNLSADEPLILNGPTGIAVDSAGNIYFTEPAARRVRMLLRTGGQRTGTVVNVTPPNSAAPQALAVGPNGDLVITDLVQSVQRIRFGLPDIKTITPSRISFAGQPLVIAGSNFEPNTRVLIGGVLRSDAVVVDSQTIRLTAPVLPSGVTTIIVSTRAGSAQKPLAVDPPSFTQLPAGSITTVAGGVAYFGDGGSPTSATLVAPAGIALGAQGVVYSVEPALNRVRKIDRLRGIISTAAGTGQDGFAGDGKLALTAMLSGPVAATVDTSGNLYIADTGNHRIRRVDANTGIISTVAGNGIAGFLGDNGPAQSAILNLPDGIFADSSDNLFVVDGGNQRVRRIDAQTGIITTVAGSGNRGFGGDGGLATSASFDFSPASQPRGVAVDANGNLLITDTGNNRIRVVDRNRIISTLVGGGDVVTPSGTLGSQIALNSPSGIFSSGGSLLIADTRNHRVLRFDRASLRIETAAGNGLPGFLGDTQLATDAELNFPEAVTVDASGNILISDQINYRIRQVDPKTLRIRTIAGSGDEVFVGDGKPATDVSLGIVNSIVADLSGNFAFPDRVTRRIRRVDGQTRLITTLAGNGTLGFSGIPERAVTTGLDAPSGIALDQTGNLYFADVGSNRILRIDVFTGILSVVAGSGNQGFSGDNGPAVSADLRLRGSLGRNDLVFDSQGNLYFTDTGNQRIRRVDPSDRIITTFAGNGIAGFSGDAKPAETASLNEPTGLAADRSGNIFIADSFNHRIRVVDLDGIISTYAGAGGIGLGQGVFGGDGGPATSARFNVPSGIAFDRTGNLFIADVLNYRIRRVDVRTTIVGTVAGTGEPGVLGDGGSAVAARLNMATAVAFDGNGNLYIVDTQNHRIRAVRGPIP